MIDLLIRNVLIHGVSFVCKGKVEELLVETVHH